MADKVTAGPWVVEQIDYEKYGLDRSFEINSPTLKPVMQTIMREIEREGDVLAEDEVNMRFVVAAHTACASINPEHPEKVAPEIPALVRQLRKARTLLEEIGLTPIPVAEIDALLSRIDTDKEGT